MASISPDPNAVGLSLAETDNVLTTAISPNDQVSSGETATPNNSVDSNAPSSTTSQRIEVNVNKRGTDLIRNNPFDDYINVTYHVSLAMVSDSAVKTLQKDTVQGAELTNDDYIVFCSTGDVDTGEIRDSVERDYYNIRSFSYTSYLGHLPQNPMVAAIWDGKMKIIEPYGFNLREDLEILSRTLGYSRSVSPSNFVYRLEVAFSGYKTTGDWKKRIPIPVHDGRTIESIVYYLTITTVEARVTSIGTEYDLSFQTFSHLTTRAESIILHKDAIHTGGTDSQSGTESVEATKGSTFRSFLQSFAKALHKQVLTDTLQQVDITYEFLGLKMLFDAPFIQDESADVASGVNFNTDSGAYVVSGKSIDIYTTISHVMNGLKLVRDLRLREDDPYFTEPGTEWNIRTNIRQTETPNDKINNYSKWTFQYIIEPVLTFRCRNSEIRNRNSQADYANQRARAQKMADSGMITRVYNYIFGGGNSEIIDFQFRFKYFYYVPYPYSGHEITMRGNSQFSDNTDATLDLKNLLISSATMDPQQLTKPDFTLTPAPGQDIGTLLDITIPPSGSSNQNTYRNIFGSIGRAPYLASSNNLSTGDNSAQQKNLVAHSQYLQYEMFDSQMTVRFDPVWLMNPYMSGKDFTPTVSAESSEQGVFCYSHVDRVVFIKAHRPNQRSFMNPDMSVSSTNSAPMLGGFYQVLTVVNRFDGGKMTQDLNMIKYDHLNYLVDTIFSTTGQQNGSLAPDPTGTGGFEI